MWKWESQKNKTTKTITGGTQKKTTQIKNGEINPGKTEAEQGESEVRDHTIGEGVDNEA